MTRVASTAHLIMNMSDVLHLSDTITFASPEHVLAWTRGEMQRGFIAYFKSEFLAHYPKQVQDVFPYFRLSEINRLSINEQDKATFRGYLEQLLVMFRSQHPYRVQMLQSLLLQLLFDCKRLYDIQAHAIEVETPKRALTLLFQHLVNQNFLSSRSVESYARMISVSPDYLSQVIKETTGRKAHDLIADRVLLDAKKLLAYSNLNISEIADYLGFSEVAHFGRYFRRYVGLSPLAWRKQQSAISQVKSAESDHSHPETGYRANHNSPTIRIRNRNDL